MKGYKVFYNDWTCRGFQFEVGKTFEEDVKPACCDRGFHFCTNASDCFNYYSFDSNNKVAEVEALGEVDTHSDDSKCSTNKIQIVREITWQEVLELVNSGDCNSGNRNSGNRNTGDCNTGNRNSGNRNTGDCNTGDWNTGDCNIGDWNSGDCNSGNCNTGDWNSGDRNTGDWNKATQTIGCFNTESQKLRFFDKETDITFEQWQNSDIKHFLNRIDTRVTDWIWSDDMTDTEKGAHPEHETTGGYLKIRDNTDCCTKWWNGLSEVDKSIIFKIPNFDLEKFSSITGIPTELLKK